MPTATQLKLQQLRHLVLLAEELHFARAAERAFLSQSAFSRSIATLEQAVGIRLFDRGPRFVQMTVDGRRVVDRARRVLSGMGDLTRELTMLRSGDLGDLAIGSSPFTAMIVMAGALAEMQRLHPTVSVRLEVDTSVSLLDELRREALDFIVADIGQLPTDDALNIEPFGRSVGGLFCRRGHPLAHRQRLRASDLRGATFASVRIAPAVRRQLGRMMGAADESGFPIVLECASFGALREFTLRTDCLMFAPAAAMHRELESGRMCELRVRELDTPDPKARVGADIGMVSLRDRTPSTAAKILMDILRKNADQIFPPGTKRARQQGGGKSQAT